MRTALVVIIWSFSSPLYAQRWDTTEVKNGRYSVFQRDELGRPKNPVAVYDTTGRLLSRVCWREGKLHGPAIQYDSLGRKTWLETYRMGKKHGTEIFYHPNGQAAWKIHYRNGTRTGASATYHPNGRLEWTKPYRRNELYGERVLRDSTGALFNGEYLTVFPLGLGQYKTICTNGRPHGELVVLRGDGTVAYTGRYNKGYPDGEFTYYDKSGKVYRTEFYAKGKCIRSSDDTRKAEADDDEDP
ncbi:MAG: hypothetical protein JNJ64_10780 [Flavobacteriales bacterium]|nr:hypothetical protein [Flavobacteriales bacterium]